MKFSNRYLFVILLIFISLLHLSYLSNGFTWADHSNIELGHTILPYSSWLHFFISRFGQTGFYRPLVSLLNSLDYDTYSRSAIGFHMTNILLHMGVVIATPFFLSVFFKVTYKEQLLSMLIVGIAPIHWLSVGGISYRDQILYTLFTMLTVVWYVKIRGMGETRGIQLIREIGIFGLFVFYALFSYEASVIMLPVLILVWELMNHYEVESKKLYGSRLILVTGMLICYFIYFVLRFIAVPEVWRVQSGPLHFSEVAGTRLVTVGKLVVQIFSPLTPQFSDASPLFQIYHVFSILTAIVIVISILYIVREGISSVLSRVILLFWISIIPAFNVVPIGQFYSPSYGYFPSVFLAMFFILIFKAVIPMKIGIPLMKRSTYKGASIGNGILTFVRMTIVPILILTWIIIASYSTFMGGYRFKNDLTLFKPELKRDDNFLEGHHYLGDYYLFHGLTSNAAKEYQRALQENKYVIAEVDRVMILNNLAGVRVSQNRLVEADSILASIEQLQGRGGSIGIRYNRALIAYRQKNYQKVVDLLYSSYRSWRRPEPLLLLSESFKHLDKKKEADEIAKQLAKFKIKR